MSETTVQYYARSWNSPVNASSPNKTSPKSLSAYLKSVCPTPVGCDQSTNVDVCQRLREGTARLLPGGMRRLPGFTNCRGRCKLRQMMQATTMIRLRLAHHITPPKLDTVDIKASMEENLVYVTKSYGEQLPESVADELKKSTLSFANNCNKSNGKMRRTSFRILFMSVFALRAPNQEKLTVYAKCIKRQPYEASCVNDWNSRI